MPELCCFADSQRPEKHNLPRLYMLVPFTSEVFRAFEYGFLLL